MGLAERRARNSDSRDATAGDGSDGRTPGGDGDDAGDHEEGGDDFEEDEDFDDDGQGDDGGRRRHDENDQTAPASSILSSDLLAAATDAAMPIAGLLQKTFEDFIQVTSTITEDFANATSPAAAPTEADTSSSPSSAGQSSGGVVPPTAADSASSQTHATRGASADAAAEVQLSMGELDLIP